MKNFLLFCTTIVTCLLSIAAENPMLYVGPKGSISLYVDPIWYTAQSLSEIPGIVLFTKHSRTEIPQQIQEKQFLDIAQKTFTTRYKKIQNQIKRWKAQRISHSLSSS